MKKPLKDRKQITITFTEEGRQKAASFGDCRDCLIATELKIIGATTVSEGIRMSFIDGVEFRHQRADEGFTHFLYFTKTAPFYGPEVVGKKLILRRAK